MVDRAGAFAHVQAGGQSACQVCLARIDGIGKIHTLGQRAGDGGRERAAGAVCVVGLDALVAEPRGEWISQVVALVIEWRGFGQYIVGLVDKMPTLNEGCATKAAGEEHGSILLRALGVDLVVEQGHGLGNIGRDNRR